MAATRLSERERIAHVYRRFGLGATPAELDEGVRIGYEAALRRLVDFDTAPPNPGDAISPWEFAWRDKAEADPGAYNFRHWWIFQMLVTPRPAREKLAMFWHNHFAVGDDKVERGWMMLEYLQVLRHQGAGRFEPLLQSVARQPAMMMYLDMERSIRGKPNENFGREVMELFTLGIGNYTEDDVKAVSRALTGWGFLDTYWESGDTNDKRIAAALDARRPFATFIEMPAMHDDSEKEILGVRRAWDGGSLMTFLAEHPATSRHLARKFWTWFAYSDPEPAVVERLASTFRRTKGDSRAMLYAIARSPEFWSDRCVRKQVKSPMDYCVGIARAQNFAPKLLAMRAKDAKPTDRIPQRFQDECGNISYLAAQMGMELFVPPDVSGWKGGEHWISPAAMVQRSRYLGNWYWGDKGPDVGSLNPLAFVKSRAPKDGAGIVAAIAELYDVPLPADRLAPLAKIVDGNGGVKVLEDVNQWTNNLWVTLKFLMAAPEAHLC